jgi:hypothetical protein
VSTYTLDAYIPSEGRYATDRGLTAREVANACQNAPLLGIQIIRVFRDDQVTYLTPEQIRAAFGG